MDQKEKAEAFRKLHHGDKPLILPNAWDVPSARLFEDAGFPAVATSSAGLMVSRGYPDGETMPKAELISVTGRIASTISVPLTADVVAGYGRGPKEVARTVKRVIEAGAIGVNIEDFDPAKGGLYPLAAQARKIRGLRELSTSLGVPFVINARTDALWKGSGTPDELFREAIRRCSGYRDAGADCVYPMRLSDATQIGRFVEAVGCPTNVMIRPGLPPVEDLQKLGVKRISFGPGASYATMGLLKRISVEVQTAGTYSSLIDGAITFDELNRLASRKGAA